MEKEFFVIGIDPGRTGGVVVLSSTRGIVKKTPFDDLDNKEISRLISSLISSFSPHAVFKETFEAYAVSSVTAFEVGNQHGWLDSTLSASGLRVESVRSKEWQKEIHLKNKDLKPKSLSLIAAKELFPEDHFQKNERSKKPHMGILEAALIAFYGKKRLELEKSERDESWACSFKAKDK